MKLDVEGKGLRLKDYKDADITLRPIQEEWADWTEEGWEESEVDVGELPVAAGKSRCATMACNYAHSYENASRSI